MHNNTQKFKMLCRLHSGFLSLPRAHSMSSTLKQLKYIQRNVASQYTQDVWFTSCNRVESESSCNKFMWKWTDPTSLRLPRPDVSVRTRVWSLCPYLTKELRRGRKHSKVPFERTEHHRLRLVFTFFCPEISSAILFGKPILIFKYIQRKWNGLLKK